MPLVIIDVIKGRSRQELRTILDTVHGAMVDAFEVPETDRYQILTQHEPDELVVLDTGLGISRTNELVVLRFISRERAAEAKLRLYRLLVERLEAACGVRPDDVVVNITESGAANWSFGHGEAQFLTGKLGDPDSQ